MASSFVMRPACCKLHSPRERHAANLLRWPPTAAEFPASAGCEDTGNPALAEAFGNRPAGLDKILKIPLAADGPQS